MVPVLDLLDSGAGFAIPDLKMQKYFYLGKFFMFLTFFYFMYMIIMMLFVFDLQS